MCFLKMVILREALALTWQAKARFRQQKPTRNVHVYLSQNAFPLCFVFQSPCLAGVLLFFISKTEYFQVGNLIYLKFAVAQTSFFLVGKTQWKMCHLC